MNEQEQPGTAPGAGPGERPPTEEEVRAAVESQLKQVTVADMVLESAVTIINVGGRRVGMAPGTEDERDLEQVAMAIEAVRGLLPLLERGPHAEQLGPLRDALARLQMIYASEKGKGEDRGESAPKPPPADEPADKPGEGAGPAQSSGRLWVPGQ